MCKCNPSIRTPFCGKGTCNPEGKFQRCPSLEQKKEFFINIAISTDDLIFIDGTLVRPISLDKGELKYMELLEFEEYVVDIKDLEEVKPYED
ncbi:hypothetical protein [Pseudoalteromonas phage PH357]|nr:hypothetical protein [Pseudoalteromonas phage PH357]